MKKGHESQYFGTKQLKQCAICPIKGLFPEVCRIHQKQMRLDKQSMFSLGEKASGRWVKVVTVGAGIGFAGAIAGLSVVPAFGMKTILGHSLGYRIMGIGTIAGGSTKVIIEMKRKDTCTINKNLKKPKPRLGLRNRYLKLPYSLS